MLEIAQPDDAAPAQAQAYAVRGGQAVARVPAPSLQRRLASGRGRFREEHPRRRDARSRAGCLGRRAVARPDRRDLVPAAGCPAARRQPRHAGPHLLGGHPARDGPRPRGARPGGGRRPAGSDAQGARGAQAVPGARGLPRAPTSGVQGGDIPEATAKALGATFTRMPSGASLAGLDAYEQQVDSIFGSFYGLEAKYITANVNLWPASHGGGPQRGGLPWADRRPTGGPAHGRDDRDPGGSRGSSDRRTSPRSPSCVVRMSRSRPRRTSSSPPCARPSNRSTTRSPPSTRATPACSTGSPLSGPPSPRRRTSRPVPRREPGSSARVVPRGNLRDGARQRCKMAVPGWPAAGHARSKVLVLARGA